MNSRQQFYCYCTYTLPPCQHKMCNTIAAGKSSRFSAETHLSQINRTQILLSFDELRQFYTIQTQTICLHFHGQRHWYWYFTWGQVTQHGYLTNQRTLFITRQTRLIYFGTWLYWTCFRTKQEFRIRSMNGKLVGTLQPSMLNKLVYIFFFLGFL